MKLLFTHLFCFMLIVFAGNAVAYDPPDGFRGIERGADIISSIESQLRGDEKKYIRKAVAYDPPDGFRGIKWGADISSIESQMILVVTKGDEKMYIMKNEKMAIGDAAINLLVYVFYKDKFYVVMINYDGISNFSKIKDTLFSAYGNGYQPNQFTEKYVWGFFGGKVRISVDYSPVLRNGSVFYTQREIDNQKSSDEKDKSKDAVKDL